MTLWIRACGSCRIGRQGRQGRGQHGQDATGWERCRPCPGEGSCTAPVPGPQVTKQLPRHVLPRCRRAGPYRMQPPNVPAGPGRSLAESARVSRRPFPPSVKPGHRAALVALPVSRKTRTRTGGPLRAAPAHSGKKAQTGASQPASDRTGSARRDPDFVRDSGLRRICASTRLTGRSNHAVQENLTKTRKVIGQ